MNLYHLPTFDDALADSAKLAEVRRVTEQAMEFAERQLEKVIEMDGEQDRAMFYASKCGLLEATVEILLDYYLNGIAMACKPDDLIPHLDDLGAA